MYYDKLKPEIDDAYRLYTSSLGPNQVPKKRVNFQAEFTKQKYANQGEEIRKKVEEFRKERQEKKKAGFKSMDIDDIQA
jgi:hypothetical protein